MRRSTLLVSATAAFAVLYLAGGAALGTPPEAADGGDTVVRWFRDNAGHVRLSMWFLTLAVIAFAIFAVLVRERLPSPHRDLFFFGAVAFAAETTVQGWLWAGLALHPANLSPATARLVLDVAIYWGPLLTSATIMTLAPVVLLGLGRRGGVPYWVGVLSAVAIVEQLVETITIFGKHGFTAPGGPMNVLLGAGLVGVAWIALGIALARSSTTA